MESLEFRPAALSTPVVFPPPPPTSNTLTSVQRAQLRKSTKKLGRILGETPRLLDEDIVSILGPVHVELPPRNEAPSPVFSDSSLDSSTYFSNSSSSSLSHYSHPYATACAPSFDSRPSTPRSALSRKPSLGLKSSLDRLTDPFDSHSNNSKSGPPILRLAVSPPSSPTSQDTRTTSSPSSSSSSPASTGRTSGKFTSGHRRSSSIDGDITKTHFTSSPGSIASDMKFTLHDARRPSTSPTEIGFGDYYEDDDINEVSFDSPSSISASNARRQKMERLRKMLGDDVPVHLVFPDQEKKTKVDKDVYWDDDSFLNDYEVIPRELSPVAVAGTAIPRSSKSNGKITGARDSMGAFTPHKANRQEHQKLRKKSQNEHVKSTSLPSTPPSLVQSITPLLPSPGKDNSHKKLGVIVESPEEHGSSVFEGFGVGGGCRKTRPMTMTMTKKSSTWRADENLLTGHGVSKSRVNDGEEDAAMNKLWSTRRGYTGWDRSMTLGRVSESPLLSLEGEKGSMGYRKLPVFVDY